MILESSPPVAGRVRDVDQVKLACIVVGADQVVSYSKIERRQLAIESTKSKVEVMSWEWDDGGKRSKIPDHPKTKPTLRLPCEPDFGWAKHTVAQTRGKLDCNIDCGRVFKVQAVSGLVHKEVLHQLGRVFRLIDIASVFP